jgi:hypothetical protein
MPVGAVTKGWRARARRARPDGTAPGPEFGCSPTTAAASRRPGHAPSPGIPQAVRRVISQHARTQPRRAGSLLPRGRDVRPPGAARLAGGGRVGDRRPRCPAGRHTGSRVHVAHVSTRPSRSRSSGGPRPGDRRDRRGDPAPPGVGHRAARRLRPGLQGQPAAAPDEDQERPCAGCSTARSTPSPPTTPRTPGTTRSTPSRTPPSGCSAWRPPSRRPRPHGADGRMRWARPRRPDVGRPGRIAGLTDHGRPIAVGEPANLVLVDPARAWTVDRAASQSLSRNNPWHGHELHRRRPHDDSCAGGTAHDGKVSVTLTSR